MTILIHDSLILHVNHQMTKRYREVDLFTCLAPSQEEKCPNREKERGEKEIKSQSSPKVFIICENYIMILSPKLLLIQVIHFFNYFT